jgi:hypothetical protein
MENMEYQMEELLPIVAKLADKYTSKESSSVPYDTARMLMEAVLYTINECYEDTENRNLLEGEKLQSDQAYEKGMERILEKTHTAKEVYHKLIEDFEDYGCKNYKDTIVKGIPAFFVRYDAKFCPQNHLLTLDYPTLHMNYEKNGIDLIYEYLSAIEIEKRFLDLFDRNAVIQLIKRIQPEYQTLYLDNICHPVLLNAMGCMIVDKPLRNLEISQQDCNYVSSYFEGDNMETMERKIANMIGLMTERLEDTKLQSYLMKEKKEYAVRLWNGMQNASLEQIFSCISEK